MKSQTKSSSLPKGAAGYVYIAASFNGLYKIGHTKDPVGREQRLNTASAESARMLCAWPCKDAPTAERILHSVFSEKCVRGEWFALEQEDIEYLLNTLGWRGLLVGSGLEPILEEESEPDDWHERVYCTHK